MYEPGTRSPWILLPGATTSSARAAVPLALKDASLSSRVLSVPLVSERADRDDVGVGGRHVDRAATAVAG